VVIRAIDARKLDDNVRKRARSAAGKRLYNGDTAAIHKDIGEYLQNHRNGVENAEAFGKSKRDFLNTVFGMMRKDQSDMNPAFADYANPERDSVVRSFRLDRMNSTMRSDGGALPLTYESMIRNMMPEPLSQRLNPFFLPEPVKSGGQKTEKVGQSADVRESERSPKAQGNSPESARAFLKGKKGTDAQVRELQARYPEVQIEGLTELGWGSEVEVYDSGDRVLKITHPGEYGIAPTVERGVGNERFFDHGGAGTPSGFLERMELSNRLFGDNLRIEGVTSDGRIVVSQRFIKGTPPTVGEIDAFMVGEGFRKIDPYVYYDPAEGVLFLDAHEGNFVKTPDSLIPIDAALFKLDKRKREIAESMVNNG